MFNIEYPLVMLLLIPAIAILARTTLFRKQISGQHILSSIIRLFIITALILALAELQIRSGSDNVARIYLLDNSGSVFLDTPSALKTIKTNTATMRPSDLVGLVVFGADAATEVMPGPAPDFPQLATLSAQVNQSGTDIQSALKLAESLLAGYTNSNKEIILLTDGNQTTGNAINALPTLAQKNIRVFTLPIGPTNFKDIRITAEEPVKVLRAGEPTELGFIIQSTNDAVVNAQLYRDNTLIQQFNDLAVLHTSPRGEPPRTGVRLTVPLQTSTEPAEIYQMRISTKSYTELCLQNNSASAIISRKGKPSVLYLSDRPGKPISQILKANTDFNLVAGQRTGELILVKLLALYDIVILDNFPLTSESDKQTVETLKRSVAGGQGLFIVGGTNSFGAGDYQNSPLAELSPIWPSPQETLGLAVILDSSGSMAEPSGLPDQTKFQVAAGALQQALTILDKKDTLEVTAFNQGYEVIQPLQAAVDMQKLHRTLAGVRSTGSTMIGPPIKNAIRTLTGSKASKKHIILLSDGYSTGGEVLNDFTAIGQALKDAGITIAIIAAGERLQQDNLLALSQNQSNGKLYRINTNDDIQALGKLIKNDLIYRKEPYKQYPTPQPVQIIGAPEILKGLGPLPPVYGYNRTGLKDRAELIAEVGLPNRFSNQQSTISNPLIAQWQYGLGRVAVFTGALTPEWAKDWLSWQALPQWLTQTLRGLVPPDVIAKDIMVSAEIMGNNSLRLIVKTPAPTTTHKYEYKITKEQQEDQAGSSVSSTFRSSVPQVGPNRFEAIIDHLNEGIHNICIFQSAPLTATIATLPVVIPYSAEWLKFNSDQMLLANIAEYTGGRVLSSLSEHQTIKNHDATVYQPLTTLLILISLGLFLVELSLRAFRRS